VGQTLQQDQEWPAPSACATFVPATSKQAAADISDIRHRIKAFEFADSIDDKDMQRIAKDVMFVVGAIRPAQRSQSMLFQRLTDSADSAG